MLFQYQYVPELNDFMSREVDSWVNITASWTKRKALAFIFFPLVSVVRTSLKESSDVSRCDKKLDVQPIVEVSDD